MIVYSIEEFRNAINKLIKKPRHGYSSVLEDISYELKGKAFLEIQNNLGDILLNQDNIRVLKVRVANSNLSIGKSGGYRLICITDSRTESIALLYAYPKKGTLAQDDIDSPTLKLLLRNFLTAKEQGLLLCHDINNSLKQIDCYPADSEN